MDAFEQIVAQLLMEEGYWTVIGYKVDILQSQADELNKSAMPRPEIDIVAYKPRQNILYLIEVKSYIDSSGVGLKALQDCDNIHDGRYKLLTWKVYREIVKRLVISSLLKKGLIPSEDINVQCGLIVGNLYKTTEGELQQLFKDNCYPDWLVWGPDTITKKVKALARKGYENNAITIISKLMHPEERKAGHQERQLNRKGVQS